MASMAVAFGGTPSQWAQEEPQMISTVIDIARERAENN